MRRNRDREPAKSDIQPVPFVLAKLSKTKLVNWELWLAESQSRESQSTAFGVHTHSSDYVTAQVQNLTLGNNYGMWSENTSIHLQRGRLEATEQAVKRRVPRSHSTAWRVLLCNRGF